ncbi:uncharacterized protein [Haliotis asinina]|uniref:uncharacterized protein n=1 Tax=Haliotis asinina TaxID=109174 RepID=UPI003531F8C4
MSSKFSLLVLAVCISGQHRGYNVSTCHCKAFAGRGTSIWELDNIPSVFKCFSKCVLDVSCGYFAFDVTRFTCTASMSSLMDRPGNETWYDYTCGFYPHDVKTTRSPISATTQHSTNAPVTEAAENETTDGSTLPSTTFIANVSESNENQTVGGTSSFNTTQIYNDTNHGDKTTAGSTLPTTTFITNVSESNENQTVGETTSFNTTQIYNGTDIFTTTQPATKSAEQIKREKEKARKRKAEQERRRRERLKKMQKRRLYWKNDHSPRLKRDGRGFWRNKGETRYNIEVATGFAAFAGSASRVSLYVESSSGANYWFHLYKGPIGFKAESIDYFYFDRKNIGPLVKFGVALQPEGMAPSWHCDGFKIYIQIHVGNQRFQIIPYIIHYNKWIPDDNHNLLYRIETTKLWLRAKRGKRYLTTL